MPSRLIEATRVLRDGALTSRAYTKQCLARIRSRDASVEAWAALDEARALTLADECDNRRASGTPLGPLHGIPVGVKDIVDTADLPTELGSPIFIGHRPERDAVVVERLRHAGAFVLGKTVTTEFAFMHPGKTRNPWNAEHTPGGSSSGSAAAVALGFVPAAIGTQTNGSVIRPASFCGVVGFKPTFGLVPFTGTCHFSETLDTVGTFTASVADAAYLAAQVAEGESIASEVPSLDRAPRLAAIAHFPWNETETEAKLHFEAALDQLRAAGARVEPIALPHAFGDAPSVHRTIMLFEAGRLLSSHQSLHRARMSAELNAGLDEGRRIAIESFRAAIAQRAALAERTHDLFEGFDSIVSPPAPGAAPRRIDITGDPSFCTLWSLTGVPAINVPSGWSRAGLPFGLQLAAASGADEYLLRVAQWCEAALRFEPRA
jgi:Asp-tRNA(Asn)/Glu-tRNA(Gln) amidotransferase A subunit family amidase